MIMISGLVPGLAAELSLLSGSADVAVDLPLDPDMV